MLEADVSDYDQGTQHTMEQAWLLHSNATELQPLAPREQALPEPHQAFLCHAPPVDCRRPEASALSDLLLEAQGRDTAGSGSLPVSSRTGRRGSWQSQRP